MRIALFLFLGLCMSSSCIGEHNDGQGSNTALSPDGNSILYRLDGIVYRVNPAASAISGTLAIHCELCRRQSVPVIEDASQVIELPTPSIGEIISNALEQYPNIETVFLDETVKKTAVAECLKWPKLEAIVVSANAEHSIDEQLIKRHKVSVVYSQASAITLLRNHDVRLVTEVSSTNRFPQIDCRHFERAVELGRYRRLPVHSPPLRLNWLPMVGKLKTLKKLDLSGCNADDNDLAHLSSLHQLSELSLRGNEQITDEGLSRVPADRLRVLDSSHTKVTGSNIARFANLKKLDVRGSLFSNSSCRKLASLKGLKSLYLCGTLVDENGLRSVESLKALRHLWLDSRYQNTDEVERIIEAIPGVEIMYTSNMPFQ